MSAPRVPGLQFPNRPPPAAPEDAEEDLLAPQVTNIMLPEPVTPLVVRPDLQPEPKPTPPSAPAPQPVDKPAAQAPLSTHVPERPPSARPSAPAAAPAPAARDLPPAPASSAKVESTGSRALPVLVIGAIIVGAVVASSVVAFVLLSVALALL